MPPSDKSSRHSFSCDYFPRDYPARASPLGGYRIDGLLCIATPLHPSACAMRRPSRPTKKLRKYLGILGPLYQIMRRGTKAGSKEEGRDVAGALLDPRACRPRTSSAEEWWGRRDSEASIHEAILHCKRSAGE
ncbi:hypothetical protein MLD38_009023 [Melastoma candidum]|uniref:Uncharacterized protein n=1 Tax=Melastoma candidum TaxID=119954 RepID=A0ACB9S0J3_9MYRT|nr:hypothetical protein MLD38_009023 [Melastoma candidum]